MADFSFTVSKVDSRSKARRGVLKTRAGIIQTPAFVPVATTGVAKGLDSRDLVEIGSQCCFCNTYHMHLKPGEGIVSRAGGLSRFINYARPIFTDSGGFQAFSLGLGKQHGIGKIGFFPEYGSERKAHTSSQGDVFGTARASAARTKAGKVVRKEAEFLGEAAMRADAEADEREVAFAKATDEGVEFKSIYDGTTEFLTPERSMQIQSQLGSDIIMAFDECTSPLSDYAYTKKAVDRTHKWASRCLKSYDTNQALYGIIQGGEWEDLRVESTRFITSQPFDGIAIGGSLGKDKEDMKRVMDYIFPLLDENEAQIKKARPRHMLGIGGVDDIFECVSRGIDTMDCVAPTRNGRRGSVFVCPATGGNAKNKWRINIDAAKFKEDLAPIDPQCDCMVCKNYTRAFLRHLHNTREYTFARLAAYHNVYFITKLFERIRVAIENDTFVDLKKEWLGQ